MPPTADEPPGTSLEAILARHGEERLGVDEFECLFGLLPSDEEGEG